MIKIGVARSVGVTLVPARMYDAAVSLARLESFCGALGTKLGVRVSPVQTRSYAELSLPMDRGDVDFAWLPPFVAFKAVRSGKARPLLAPVRGGSTSFFAALFVAQSSKLQSASELAGSRAAWVDRESAAGYRVVRAALKAQGYQLDGLFVYESFEGSHQAVVQAVMEGTADVGATYVHRDPNRQLLFAGWGDAELARSSSMVRSLRTCWRRRRGWRTWWSIRWCAR
ncbi:MAG: PhnD/SsuA/transferrin family substrate-binding protein [Polyangiaceae bacterium]